MENTYSLIRSRTFWTLVFMFLANGFLAISGELDPTFVMVVNAMFSVIASYFHIQTGKSTTGSN